MNDGYRTGEVAGQVGVDVGTVKNWVREIPDYFTEGAQGKLGMQRLYTTDDMYTLNTVRILRERGTKDWNDIRTFLDTESRFTELPINSLGVNTGQTPLQAVQDALALKAELDATVAQLKKVEDELQFEREGRAQERRESSERIEALARDAGRYQGQVELLKEMLKEQGNQKDAP